MKKIITFALVLIMIISTGISPEFGSSLTVEAAEPRYSNGDIIEFGSYPQTEVKDETLLSTLNSQNLTWTSYGYYYGSYYVNNSKYGSMRPGDFMKYADVTYSGEKYRAVHIIEGRPGPWTCYPPDSSNSVNHLAGNIYWFKYEPIKWKVLDANKGLLLSNIALDAQPFSNEVYVSSSYPKTYYNSSNHSNYATNYATSSIRAWLNNNFLNTAFTSGEQEKILATELDNTRSDKTSSVYDSVTTYDKVFIPSLKEVTNKSYGFSDINTMTNTRTVKCSDYAESQGLERSTAKNVIGNCEWWTRTHDFSSLTCVVVAVSGSGFGAEAHYNSGVRPAICVKDINNLHVHKYSSKITENPSCEEDGVKTYSCSCGYSYTESIPATDHSYNNGVVTKNPKCTEKGIKTYSCACGDFYTEEISETGHTASAWITDVEPTIETDGKKIKKCKGCSIVLEEGIIPKLEAKDFINVSIDNVAMNYKSTVALNAKFGKLDGVDYTVVYESSNVDVVSVDENGNLVANGNGTATITCTITDEFRNTKKDTCTVEVTYAWWQWIILIVLFGWIWY